MRGLLTVGLAAVIPLVFVNIVSCNAEEVYRKPNEIMWCCLTAEELDKCNAFALAAEEDNLKSDLTFGSYYRSVPSSEIRVGKA